MSVDIATYKTQQIVALNAIFKTNASKIHLQYKLNISKINSLRTTRSIKIYYIQYFTNQYNQLLRSMQNKLIQDVNKINALINIPGVSQIVANTRNNPDKFALIIGINYSNTPNQLFGCINDANNMNKFLNSRAYKTENVVVLTDNTISKPTKKNIMNGLTQMLKNSIKGDSLVFSYSGHGTHTADLNGDETDKQDEMIVPIDYATSKEMCIKDDEIKYIIDSYLKPDTKLFMLFDACFSGTICDLKYNYLDNLGNTNINPKSNETAGQVICISGCSDSQTSAEAAVTDGVTPTAIGAMSFVFLNTINTDGISINMKMLLDKMRTTLSDHMYTQVVQMSSGRQIDISNTILSDII